MTARTDAPHEGQWLILHIEPCWERYGIMRFPSGSRIHPKCPMNMGHTSQHGEQAAADRRAISSSVARSSLLRAISLLMSMLAITASISWGSIGLFSCARVWALIVLRNPPRSDSGVSLDDHHAMTWLGLVADPASRPESHAGFLVAEFVLSGGLLPLHGSELVLHAADFMLAVLDREFEGFHLHNRRRRTSCCSRR